MKASALRIFGSVFAAGFLAWAGTVTAKPIRFSHMDLAQAPSELVAAIVQTETRAAARNPAYDFEADGCVALPPSDHQVLHGCFDTKGAHFFGGSVQLRIKLSAWGQVGALEPVKLRPQKLEDNRISYFGDGIGISWQVSAIGFEQSFQVMHAPKGSGPILLQLTASSAPRRTGNAIGWGALRYGQLYVTDASGKVLPATLRVHGKTITLAIDASHARYPLDVDPLVWLQQEATAADGVADSEFGNSVALSDNGATALVGAPDETVGTDAGAAYVFTLANNVWSQTAELTATDDAANDNFGTSVALSGDGATALVGAPHKTVGDNTQQGTAYVFSLAGSTWKQTAEFIATDGAAYDSFGTSVALSSDATTALVGASSKNVGTNDVQGAVYVYDFTNNNWARTAELTAADGTAGENFGWSVALSDNGTTALVGAIGWGMGFQGAAYVFALANGSWTQRVQLTAANGKSGDYFGRSVALSANGDTALVGAYGTDFSQGAAYVFTLASGVWSQTAALAAPDAVETSLFGSSVALSGDGATAIVGADNTTVGANFSQGSAYVFTLVNGTWNQTAEIAAADAARGDNFGSSAALSADSTIALVGAPGKTVGGNSGQGAVYFLDSSNLSAVLSAPATVQAGEQFASQYILTNASTTASAPVSVQLPLPASNAAYASASATPGSCAYNITTQVATCALGSISGNGGTASASLVLKATGTLIHSTIDQSAELLNGTPNLEKTAGTEILPLAPTVTGSGAVTVTGPGVGTETLTLSGTIPLTISATSSNTTLLPDNNITGISSCTGPGTCILTLTPASGQIGSATITITATDSYGQTGSNAFTFTVLRPSAPVISGTSDVSVGLGITGTEIFALSGTGLLKVTATSSNTTLLPDTNITSSSGCTAAGNCMLTLTPASGQIGTATVTVTVTDGFGQTGTGGFSFTVVSAAPPPNNPPPPSQPSNKGGGGGGGFGGLGLITLLMLVAQGALRRRSHKHPSRYT